MKTVLLTMAAMTMISGSVMAGAVHQWKGTGSAYSLDGKLLSSYQVSVVNTEIAANMVQSETTIILEDGSQKVISQKITEAGSSWSVDSNLGHGGGACYGDICQNYIADASGMAYATSIVIDGPKARRDMTTELQNGKAIKVLRDSLTQIQ